MYAVILKMLLHPSLQKFNIFNTFNTFEFFSPPRLPAQRQGRNLQRAVMPTKERT